MRGLTVTRSTYEVSFQDIANELGLTREVLYRTLASLELAGAIERNSERILLKRSFGQ